MPTAKPHSSHSCHGAVITSVSPEPSGDQGERPATTRRTPNRSISAAAKGAVSP